MHTCFPNAQFRALRDGYSFNTALPVDENQDPLRVDRQAEVVQLSGANTTAGLKDRGTHICLVRARFCQLLPAA